MEDSVYRLATIVKIRGTGLPGLTASIVQRTEDVAWYLRSDDYHEIFSIKVGRSFDGSQIEEYYPGNEDFGKTAWCTRYLDRAAQIFQNLCSGSLNNGRSHSRKVKIPLNDLNA